jgi:flagellar motor component MotA
MSQEQAIEILVQVARLAQKGGLLSLEDANAVLAAIQQVAPKADANGLASDEEVIAE